MIDLGYTLDDACNVFSHRASGSEFIKYLKIIKFMKSRNIDIVLRYLLALCR